MPSIAGKSVLIIGGTSGIGFGVAQAALASGAKVVVASSKADKVSKAIFRLQAEFPDAKDKISGFPVDLNDVKNLEGNVQTLYKQATNDGADLLDHIVNTAGTINGMKALADASPEDLLAIGTLRLIAPLILAKHSPSYLRQSTDSSITFTSGTLADKPMAGRASLAGWASALDGATRGLALDFLPVRVNVVKPGLVKTELWENSELATIPEEVLVDKWTALKRAGDPETAAEAFIYLMRDGFATGSIVSSNGGALLI